MTSFHTLLINGWLVQTAAKAFSLNQPEIFCSTLSCQPSPSLQSSLFSHSQPIAIGIVFMLMCACICVCECDDLYQVLQCECDDLFQALQTNIRTYVHQGRIEPPQCVVYSPHALALGNNPVQEQSLYPSLRMRGAG